MSNEVIIFEEGLPSEAPPQNQSASEAHSMGFRKIAFPSDLRGEELERSVLGEVNLATQSVGLPYPQRLNRETWTVSDLIGLAKTSPPKPIIEGLLNEGDILLLHGTEESFKSVMIVQCAESIAMGTRFLRKWPVRGQRRVGVIETEMHEVMMGERLTRMFSGTNHPEHMYFMSEELLIKWRRQDLDGKFQLIKEWVKQEDIEVLIIDTANDFFRGLDSPSEERVVGKFFDELRRLQLKGRIIVRHDRKRREVDDSSHSNELIRGSSEWKEDPEAIIHLKRIDKRTNEVQFEVGKLRYGVKPEPCNLWFDARCFRLVPLPPVIAVLEAGVKTREELLTECKQFGLAERSIDAQISQNKQYLKEQNRGHQKTLEIDPTACRSADWFSNLEGGAV
jgi:AAA domain